MQKLSHTTTLYICDWTLPSELANQDTAKFVLQIFFFFFDVLANSGNLSGRAFLAWKSGCFTFSVRD